MTEENSIDLNELQVGMPALTPALGKVLAEAAAVCLENQLHQPGVMLKVEYREELEEFRLVCPDVTGQLRSTYHDLQEAVEWGATGIAVMLLLKQEQFVTLQRLVKGTGFDYWIGPAISDEELPFQGLMRMEVSGILHGTRAKLNQRMNEKLQQTQRSDQAGFRAVVVIVEFSMPLAKVQER